MLAPAETSAKENHLQAEFETCIGIIPHQVSKNIFVFRLSVQCNCCYQLGLRFNFFCSIYTHIFSIQKSLLELTYLAAFDLSLIFLYFSKH